MAVSATPGRVAAAACRSVAGPAARAYSSSMRRADTATMRRDDTATILRARGVQPSAQRLAVAQYVLFTDAHPSAERVFAAVRSRIPMISRATVYNTLNLLVEKGLLRQLEIAGGRVAFDPRVEPHHHLVDEETGAIHDVPWDALQVRGAEALRGFRVSDYQVVLRGRPSSRRSARRGGPARR